MMSLIENDTKRRENGGRFNASFRSEIWIDSITNGARSLYDYKLTVLVDSYCHREMEEYTKSIAIENGLNTGIKRYTGAK